jgi:hypothetical protein
MHNELGITQLLDPRTRPFWDRPYQVLDAGRYTAALLAAVTDAGIRRRPVLGVVDEFVDDTDAPGRTKFLRAVIAAASPPAESRASA